MSQPITLGTLHEITDSVILPGVAKIVDDKIGALRAELRDGLAEMRKGFAGIDSSLGELSGEIAELSVKEKDRRHEERIVKLERRAGLRAN